MRISYLLLEPDIKKLEAEFLDLERALGARPDEESQELKLMMDREKRDLEKLQRSVADLETNAGGVVPTELYDLFRRLKLDLHFTRRKFKRFQSNEARLRKIQERRSNVSTFAA